MVHPPVDSLMAFLVCRCIRIDDVYNPTRIQPERAGWCPPRQDVLANEIDTQLRTLDDEVNAALLDVGR